MIISKCCKACGSAFEQSQLTNGLCPWCDSYQYSYKTDMALSVLALCLLVVMTIGLAWLFT